MRKAFCAALSFGFVSALFVAASPRLSAETIVNNILSPFSSIQIIGSRGGPRPPYKWSPECNQGFSDWRPVCAVTRNRIAITYSNRCMAELDQALIIDNEPCPITSACAPSYEPVCGRVPRGPASNLEDALRSPHIRPFINECYARAQVVWRFTHDIPPRLEEESYGDVTILRKYGDDLFQYPAPGRGPVNASRRYQYYGHSGMEDFTRICPRSCPEGGLVVCAVDHNNVPRLYKNRCSAILAGADPTRFRFGDVSKCR